MALDSTLRLLVRSRGFSAADLGPASIRGESTAYRGLTKRQQGALLEVA